MAGLVGKGGASSGISYVTSATDPTALDDADDGYAVGKRWLNTTDDKEFVLLDNAAGSAVWVETTAAGGAGAPTNAQYLTLATNGSLSVERVLTPGTGLTGTDGGAGGAYTLDVNWAAPGAAIGTGTPVAGTFTTVRATAASGSGKVDVLVTGEANPKLEMNNNGRLNFGLGGASAVDAYFAHDPSSGQMVKLTGHLRVTEEIFLENNRQLGGKDSLGDSQTLIIRDTGDTVVMTAMDFEWFVDDMNAFTLGMALSATGNLAVTGTVQGTRLISTVATGTAPATAASTTVVTNWNADLLDGLHGSHYLRAKRVLQHMLYR